MGHDNLIGRREFIRLAQAGMSALPFVPAVASLRQMRYLWDEPRALDGTALAQRIGAEPHTPFAQAVGAAIAALALAPPGAQTLPAGAGRTAAGGA